MTRNGLPLLVAIFTVLALFVRPESTLLALLNVPSAPKVMAQIYQPIPEEIRQGLIYNPSLYYEGTLSGINIGNVVTINVAPDGINTIIKGPTTGPNAIPPLAKDKQTNNQTSGVVFWNYSGTSSITADGSGAVISNVLPLSTTPFDTPVITPAIRNGSNTMRITPAQRVYKMKVTKTDTGYRVDLGYALSNDPEGWNPLGEDDDLPEGLAEWALPGMEDPYFGDDGTGTAIGGRYTLPGFPDLATTGDSKIIDAGVIDIVDTLATEPVEVSIPWAPSFHDQPGLEPVELPSGTYSYGTLTINQRDANDPLRHRYEDDKRTLISTTDNSGLARVAVAIENHGVLTVNDAIVKATGGMYGNIGILHEFSRGVLVDEDGFAVGYTTSTGSQRLVLNNTQIGTPEGDQVLWMTDANGNYLLDSLGQLRPVIDPETELQAVVDSMIDINTEGEPVQTVSRIARDAAIKADGVNGRIVAGQSVTLNRNPLGSMASYEGEKAGTFANTQRHIDDINLISGTTIGILAQPHLFEEDRREQVYFNTWYINPFIYGGMFDMSHVSTLGNNTVQLNDNSWIYASTGIAFGNAASGFVGVNADAIRISVDSTSGIYAGGSGNYDLGLEYGGVGSMFYGNDATGITDRYSLIQLYAVIEDDSHNVAVGGGYSGSFNEIEIGGKVMAGTQSITGIRLSFQPSVYNSTTGLYEVGMSNEDKGKLSNIYYKDPNDPYADVDGYVYYYSSDRTPQENAEVAARFVAYDTQPNRVFWIRLNGKEVPLTYFDEESQRWVVHPGAPQIEIHSGQYNSSNPYDYFSSFDTSSGLGIDIVGTSMAYEGEILLPNIDPWSVYFGPTVREITTLGKDALVAGGKFYGGNAISMSGLQQTTGGGAAIQIGDLAHVAKIIVGENNDVKNLSDVLFDPNDPTKSIKNFQAFDTMTAAKRSKFLYDSDLLYSNDETKFHFDNAGIHGDIVSWYNAVVDAWGGGGGGGEGGTAMGNGYWSGGVWTGAEYSHSGGNLSRVGFWMHTHDGGIEYEEEILGVDTSDGPSYLLGHRDLIGTGYSDATIGWTAAEAADAAGMPGGSEIPGRSLILDEILLYNLAGRLPHSPFLPGSLATSRDSFGYADNARHFREALAWFMYGNGLYTEQYAGLSTSELLAGYTRDGTVLTFTNGDIFSENIFGGGVGDRLNSDIFYFLNGSMVSHQNYTYYLFGNIDLRFANGTTIFNRNTLEIADGSNVLHYPGIRVRDVYVEKTGHLMLNDAEFAVNPFHPLYNFRGANTGGSGANFESDYDDRLIIHDVLNEGVISGNGVFQIAQRFNFDYGVDYFEGYLINRGILAPGLNGFIGENEFDAGRLEQEAYDNMLESVTNTSGDGLWEQLMRGVPGGQFGTMTIFGSLRLMDEHTRPVYDPFDPKYNIEEKLDAGEFHVTIGNDTVKDVFNKYVNTIAGAKATYDPTSHTYDTSVLADGEISQEDWKVIAMEKLGTHLSWFSTSAMVDKKTGLPLLTQYEQFEYLTDTERRGELQRKMLEMVLTEQELRLYDNDPAQRAALNQRMFQENNIRFEFTEMDTLLWRYGFSDVVSVHGTIPSYWYKRNGWQNNLSTYNILASSFYNNPNNTGSSLIGMTQLGGVVQADRIYDTDDNAATKEEQTSFIIIASEGYTYDGSVKTITSDTSDWVFANIDLMPAKLATGQTAAVLTVIDDKNYYRNQVSTVTDSFNAKSVASTLDKAMLTNPGLALSFQFGMNSPEVLSDTFRQVASSTRSNSVVMNLWSPSDQLFNQIGYGHGGMSTGRRGNVVFQNMQNGQLQQPYGQPAVPPPGTQYAPPMGGTYRGQSPMHRTGSIWGAYTNTTFTMGDDGNSYEYNFYRNGAMIGSEWNLTPSSVLGGVASLSQGTFESLSDEVKSTDYSFGLYFVAAPFEQFEVKSYLGGGYQSYKSDRYIRNGEVFIGGNTNNTSYGSSDIYGLNDHYDSETQGYSLNYAIEFARPFTVNPNFVIRPAAGFEYQNIRQNAYSEQMNEGAFATWANNGVNMAEFNQAEGATSGTYGMNYKKMDFSRALVRFGVNTESYFARGGWQFRGYYIHKLAGDRYPVSTQSFTSGSSTFNVRGAELGNGYVQVGLGSFLWLNRDRTATLSVNGDWNFSLINNGYSMLNINTGVQLNF